MKKYVALLLALLLTTAMLTGCGASNGVAMDSAGSVEMAPAAPEMPAEDISYENSVGSSSADAVEYTAQQKLIREVRITAETEDLEPLLASLSGEVAGLGGYVENQEVYNGSMYSSYRYRSANLIIRIPAENLDSFVGQVRGISNVVNYSESATDVTLQYVSTESRVAALETEEARLLELMEQAETMSDLLEVEARLTDVRAELEMVASQLRVLANKVNYATVYLEIDQVRVYTEVEEQTVWQRIGTGFRENLRRIGENLVDFFVWAVTYSPQLIFWAAVITAVVVLVKRRLKKRKARKADNPQ